MTQPRENVLLIHWHDLGRHLHSYGVDGVVSPHTDRLAEQSLVFTDAHATAPLCSPSRGSLLTGRYPHENGLLGLAHHGWEFHDDVETLPQILSEAGWHTVLYGMQHETSHLKRLGYDEYDASNSYCDHVVARAKEFVARDHDAPFLLNTGFFETHRPYPASHYEYADPATVTVPDHLPDTPDVREDLAGFYGSITKADAAVGRLLDALERHGLDESTWVVFFTDHGAALPRAKSTLYAPGTGIAFMIRPPRGRGVTSRRVDTLFSGVDLVPTLLDVLGLSTPLGVHGVSHAPQILGETGDAARHEVYTEKTYHDSYDPIRAVRTKQYAYIENYAPRPELDLPLDIQDSLSGRAVADEYTRPRARVELYDLVSDPHETTNVADDPRFRLVVEHLSGLLGTWRAETGDVLPSDAEGTAIAERNMAAYLAEHPAGPTTVQRSALGRDRGYTDPVTAG